MHALFLVRAGGSTLFTRTGFEAGTRARFRVYRQNRLGQESKLDGNCNDRKPNFTNGP
jgi:hypothetical protein